MARLGAVHNGVVSILHACRLAQLGRLGTAGALATLRSLRHMQQPAGQDRAGCLRWYWEESAPVDTNASFFIGLSLQLLYLAEGDRLDAEVRRAIREIVADLVPWFEGELVTGNPRYPNKCLGDLICGWLGAEVLGRAPSSQLVQVTGDWCEYWRRECWGWGEHLSDIYAAVLLAELSALLLFCPRLPDELRAGLAARMADLLAIEDAFAGGPRVPLIRSYAFNEAPTAQAFRPLVAPVTPDSDAEVRERGLGEVFGPWFHRAGWARLAPAAAKAREWIELPCHAGSLARAVVRPTLRVGAMSRYPVMAGVEQLTWGLSWQSFPAALWRSQGDWAFWRWITREGDRVRAHPALDRSSAYLGNALAEQFPTPPVPEQTSTLTAGGRLELWRTLPVPEPSGWTEVTDAFCLLDSSAVVTLDGTRLRLRWSDCTVTVELVEKGPPRWEPHAGGGWWVVRKDRAALRGQQSLVHHWVLTLDA